MATKQVELEIKEKGGEQTVNTLNNILDVLNQIVEEKKEDTNATIENKNANESNNNALKKTNSLLKLSNFKVAIYGIKQLGQSFKSLVSNSYDYIENLNLMDSAFGSTSEDARKWVETISEIYGMDESGLTKRLGTFRQFGSALGFAGDQADTLAKNLTLMAGDVSSLYNISLEDATQKLRSALTGETQAIRQLGADITQTSLQQTLYNMGINESIENMSRAEKTLLIYISLNQQLSNSQGDLAKTINAPANQMRILTEQTSRLARAIGNSLLPIIASVLPYLNAIMMTLVEIFNFISTLLGYDVSNFSFGGSLTDDDYFSGISDSLDDVTDSANGTNKALDDTKKKLTGLRGFDKLNVINTPSTSSSSSGGGSAGGSVSGGGINSKLLEGLKDYNAYLGEASDKAQKIRNSILEWLGFTQDANGEWKLTNVTWGNMLLAAVGIATAFGLLRKVAKILGLSSFAGGAIKGIKTLIKLVGTGSAAGGGAAAASGTGLVASFGVIAAVVIGIGIAIAATIGSVKALSKAWDNAKVGIKKYNTEYTTFEKISLGVAAAMPVVRNLVDIIMDVKHGLSQAVDEVDLFSEGISKATQNKLKPFYDDLEVLDKKIAEIEITGIVDDKDVKVVTDKVKSLSTQIVNELDSDKNKELKNLQPLKSLTDPNLYKKITKATEDMYNERKGKIEKAEKEINDIVKKANKERRALTKEEQSKINELRNKMEDEALDSMTKNEEELYKIKLRAKNNREAITVEEAAKQLHTAKQTKEKVIKEAKDQYQGVVDQANVLLEAGKINKEEYGKIVKAAKETRDKTIDSANKQYDEINKTTKSKLGENYKYVDENNGKVKTNWQVMWEDMKADAGKFFTKKYWKDKWKTVKDKFNEESGSLKTDFEIAWDKVMKVFNSKYFTKKYWKEKWQTIKDTFEEYMPTIKWDYKDGYKATGKLKTILEKLKLPTVIPKLKVYADGGFVDKGQMFVARESGPELVGKIGNKTAVANNDQIVEAVSLGVARAIQTSNFGNATTIIEAKGDTSGLMNFITFEQKKQERQFGL